MDVDIDGLAEAIGSGIEGVGVVVILIGIVVSTLVYARRLRRRDGADDAFRFYRRDLGRGLLLGLEFLVAGDIIRTVAATPTFTDIGVVVLIVLLRTFLSFTLELETEGRWPWQTRRNSDAPPARDT